MQPPPPPPPRGLPVDEGPVLEPRLDDREGTIKIKVDDALPNPQGNSLGVVLRDSNGSVCLVLKRTQRSHGNASQAEDMTIDFGCKNVTLESDSMQALRVAASSEDCYLSYGSIVEDLRSRVSLFDSSLSLYPC
ncbi:hypothetical protein SLA2020_253780 [Shorea laevis]